MVRSIDYTLCLRVVILAVFLLTGSRSYAHLPQRADCVVIIEIEKDRIGILRKLYIGDFLAFEIMDNADTNQDDIIQPEEAEQIKEIISKRIDSLHVRIDSGRIEPRRCSRELTGVPNRIEPRVIQFSQLFTCPIPEASEKELNLHIETGDIRLPVGEYRVFSSLTDIPSNTCFSVNKKNFISALPGSCPVGFRLQLAKSPAAERMDPDMLTEILSFNTVEVMSRLSEPERFRIQLAESAAPVYAILSGTAAFLLGLILLHGMSWQKWLRRIRPALSIFAVTLALPAILTIPTVESRKSGLILILVWATNAGSVCITTAFPRLRHLFQKTILRKKSLEKNHRMTAAGIFLTITGMAAMLTGLYAATLIHPPLLNRLLGF